MWAANAVRATIVANWREPSGNPGLKKEREKVSGFETVIPAARQRVYDNWHFAPATRSSGMLYLSGVIGTGRGGKAIEGPEEQFEAAFKGVELVLGEAGAGFADVVEMTTYHVGLNEHIATFMKVKDRFVAEPYPAWTAIGVSELAVPGGLVEIRVIAKQP